MKDEIKIKKKNFLLCNCPYPNKKIFKLITKNIPNSIFTILDFSFFKEMVNKKIIDLYIIKKNKKISSIITVTSFKNYQKLKRNIINYLFLNPLKVFKNIPFFLRSVSRDSNEVKILNKKNYLHLLHLIIFKYQFKSIKIKLKDEILNFFFTQIVKINNAKSFYLCYEYNNIKAHKFYKRNKFLIYKRNKNHIFIKKKFI